MFSINTATVAVYGATLSTILAIVKFYELAENYRSPRIEFHEFEFYRDSAVEITIWNRRARSIYIDECKVGVKAPSERRARNYNTTRFRNELANFPIEVKPHSSCQLYALGSELQNLEKDYLKEYVGQKIQVEVVIRFGHQRKVKTINVGELKEGKFLPL